MFQISTFVCGYGFGKNEMSRKCILLLSSFMMACDVENNAENDLCMYQGGLEFLLNGCRKQVLKPRI